MKNIIKIMLSVILVAATIITVVPAGEAKAAELPEPVKKGANAAIEKILNYAALDSYGTSTETIESFGPAKYATYGFIAQRLYHSYHRDMPELPSQKKAIAWLKDIYCEIAKQYPDQAEELAEAFLDGRGEKWSYKKKASYDFIEKTLVVVAYYTNDGAYLKYAPFSVSNFVLLDRFAVGGELKMREWYYNKWKNYGGTSEYPSRLVAIEFMLEVSIQIHNPPFGKK